MGDRAFASATELANEIRDRHIGCVELLDFYLARAERHNPALNAIVVWQVDQARERARAADAALARGERWGPLHGISMTVKESFNVAGLPTTFGNLLWKDNIATSNAFMIDRLLQAGAIIFGKTNVPYMLADAQSYNDIYGTTNNPWDPTRSPGGPSGDHQGCGRKVIIPSSGSCGRLRAEERTRSRGRGGRDRWQRHRTSSVGVGKRTRRQSYQHQDRRPASLAETGQRLEVVGACVLQLAAAGGKILGESRRAGMQPGRITHGLVAARTAGDRLGRQPTAILVLSLEWRVFQIPISRKRSRPMSGRPSRR